MPTYEQVRDKADEICEAYLHGSGVDQFAKDARAWLRMFSALGKQQEREYRKIQLEDFKKRFDKAFPSAGEVRLTIR